MDQILWAALPFIGLLGGFFSGFLGLGGGVIMLPLLTLLGGVPLKLVTGTDLVHVLITSATSTIGHYRGGMVDTRIGLFLGLSGIAGGLLGSFLSVPLSPFVLQVIYLFVVALGAFILFLPAPLEFEGYRKGEFNRNLGIATGLGVGALTGMLGVGGGFITVPVMIYILKMPLRVAIGTSLFFIFITSLGTIWAKFGVGHIHVSLTLLVLSGSITGALIGPYVSRRTPVRFLRFALVALLILILIVFGYKTFWGQA
ncbi:MAG: hypothetical protein AMJ94_12190 [Deltaproteobacteria bacterium SM23_61]|nr:MAG: hypothetical protein AMJ94_12190 [Deltaproteobacteria bacterium SM23_61]